MIQYITQHYVTLSLNKSNSLLNNFSAIASIATKKKMMTSHDNHMTAYPTVPFVNLRHRDTEKYTRNICCLFPI